MEARTRSEPSAVQGMLWDNTGVEPIELVADRRGVAFALTACARLAGHLRSALDLASFDVIVLTDVETCRAAIATGRPDIIFLDERMATNAVDLRTVLAQSRVTESLPVLPISPDGPDDGLTFALTTKSNEIEIFLKTRAILRRERSTALSGKRLGGAFVLDEPRFKLFFADRCADLSKTDLCLLGPFFDVKNTVLDRQSLERLVFETHDRKAGSRIVDFQISRMRRRVKAQLGIDPLRSVRGIGYALACA